ncbi:VOC family protein [Bradyrhizobium manausense]|uniref:bleomycin resistance protein n=1 Tax=Bradyrhizobium manausense TaxID=989370 RepID=UPI001BAA528A|nr:VOC family protein [Bradyrhizobium manausense]MBR0827259.1 VOC family protein [Bradyrhizobium manausense]
MIDEGAMMVGSAAVFAVADMETSVSYYRDVLGFDVTFQYGEPIYYTCLCRDEVALHLNASTSTTRLPGHGSLCVFVRDVDGLYAELVARGARTLKAPQTYAYGMRDFDVLDPDGNQLVFGMGVSAAD